MRAGLLALGCVVLATMTAAAPAAPGPGEDAAAAAPAIKPLTLELAATDAMPPAQPPPGPDAPTPPGQPTKPAAPPEGYKTGACHLLLTGDAEVTFTALKHSKSMWEGELGLLFLIQFNDRLLAEVAIDTSIASMPLGGEPDRNLTLAHANLSYRINDRLTVAAGILHVPFGLHMQHFGAPWINQFPDDPLPYADRGLAPDVALGVVLTGAAPVGPNSRITYSFYVTDGAELSTQDPGAAGDLTMDRFHNFEYVNRNQGAKAVGGRLACLPCPDLEVGFSVQGSKVEPEHFKDTNQFLFGIHAAYFREFQQVKGQIRARAEWIWSNVDERTFDPTGALGFGPLRYNNNRNGGYWQAGYRPTRCGNAVLANTEFLIRYDRLNVSENAPSGGSEDRWTPGVAYWITPSMVIKAAYEYDKMQGSPADNLLIVQFAIGF